MSVAGRVVRALTWLVDPDREGSAAILGGGDCDDFDPAVGPFRPEIEANGRDENCDGRDFVARAQRDLAYPADRTLARGLAKRANSWPTVILLIDALRADRVGVSAFPHLAELVRRSRWYRVAYAPASSTSLSIPAIAVGRPLPGPSSPSVFDHLRGAGFRTGLVTVDAALDAITGKVLTYGNLAYPFRGGFDEGGCCLLATSTMSRVAQGATRVRSYRFGRRTLTDGSSCAFLLGRCMGRARCYTPSSDPRYTLA